MELDQIRYFLAIVKEGSLSRAAAQFNVTQAAITRSMDRLQRSVGATLLNRHTRGTSLTEEGERFAILVSPLLEEMDQARLSVIARADSPAGRVRVGLAPSVMSVVGGAIIRETRMRFPEIELTVECAFSADLVEQLRRDRIDLAATAVLGHSPGLTQRPLGTYGLYHLGHRALIKQREDTSTLTMSDLRDQPLVLPGPRHVLRRLLDRAAKLAGFTLVPYVESNSIAAILDLVRSGEASAILAYGATIRELTNSTLAARRLNDQSLRLPLAFLTSASRTDTQASREVARLLVLSIRRATQVGTLAQAEIRIGRSS